MPDEKTKGPVPLLRFPEFRDSGEWEVKRLGEVARLRNGYAFKSSTYTDDGVYQIITIANVQEGILSLESTKRIASLPNDIQQHQILKPGDILISMTGNVGRVCRVTTEALLLNQRVGKLEPENNINAEFLYQWLQRPAFRKVMELRAAGGAQGNLSSGDITGSPLYIPKLATEQQKIADCLGSLDDLIRAEEAALEALKKHKKGLMQRLFPREGETTPRLRFPEFRDAGEWEVKRLGNKSIAIFIRDRIPSENIPYGHYVSTVNLLPDFGGLATEPEAPPLNNAIAYRKGDILMSNIRPYLKKVWIADRSGGASNDVLVVRAGKSIRGAYLGHLLISDRFISHVMGGAKGVKMPRGDLEQIKNFQVPVPPTLNEQQKIADFLSSLDDLIRAKGKKIEALKQHKKGLMQRLFPQEEA